jgi:hypothetical protein
MGCDSGCIDAPRAHDAFEESGGGAVGYAITLKSEVSGIAASFLDCQRNRIEFEWSRLSLINLCLVTFLLTALHTRS